MLTNLTVIGQIGNVTEALTATTPYIRLSVASSYSYKDKAGKNAEHTDWFSVALWGEKQIEYYKGKLHKGDLVVAIGRPEIRVYDNNGEKRVDIGVKVAFGGLFRVLRYKDVPQGARAEEPPAALEPGPDTDILF
jgi:single-stranded DNA-binding protein